MGSQGHGVMESQGYVGHRDVWNTEIDGEEGHGGVGS